MPNLDLRHLLQTNLVANTNTNATRGDGASDKPVVNDGDKRPANDDKPHAPKPQARPPRPAAPPMPRVLRPRRRS